MIVVNTVQAIADLLARAEEIAREEHIPFKTAVLRAGHEQANLRADVARRICYRPAAGAPHVPIGHWRYRPTKQSSCSR